MQLVMPVTTRGPKHSGVALMQRYDAAGLESGRAGTLIRHCACAAAGQASGGLHPDHISSRHAAARLLLGLLPRLGRHHPQAPRRGRPARPLLPRLLMPCMAHWALTLAGRLRSSGQRTAMRPAQAPCKCLWPTSVSTGLPTPGASWRLVRRTAHSRWPGASNGLAQAMGRR